MNNSFATMRAKWTYMFATLDANKDGLVSKEELGERIQKYIDEYKLTEPRALGLKFAAMTLSDMIMDVFGNGSKAVNLNEFISAMTCYLLKKPEHFHDGWETFYSNMFDILDIDEDGAISLSEFNIYYKRFGRDLNRAQKAFNAIDTDHDGSITRTEFVTAYMNYLSNPDYTVDHLPLFY